MKKNLHRIIMSALLTVVATVAASAQCYIVGSDGQWKTNAAAAELTETATAGVYEGDVAFAEGAQYFTVTQNLTTDDTDWETFNQHRFGPSEIDAKLAINVPMAMIKGKDRSFKVPTAATTYRMRVDFNAMTVTLIGNFPDELYVWGSDGVYNPTLASATLPKTETDGVYKATVDFTSCYFNILTQLGTDPNDYEAILPYRYGGGKVVINRDKAMTLTEQSFHIATPGTYDVTVDLRTMTMNLHSDTYVPEYQDHVYLIGANGSNFADQGAELTWDEVDGIYTGYVTFYGNKFTISTALASTYDGWDEIKDKRIGAVAPTVDVETNLTIGLKKGEVSDFIIGASTDNPLTAYVTLDLVNNRLTLHGNDASYPIGYPKELYTLGCNGNWFTNIPADVISATNEPGIYEGEITFVGEVGDLHFIVLKRLGADWDFVNAKRLSPYTDGDPANLDSDIPAMAPDVSPGAWLFSGEPGTYDIKVDLTKGNGVIRISAKGATGITATTAAPATKNYYYDLNGRFLGNVEPQKGVYVVKGKKVKK